MSSSFNIIKSANVRKGVIQAFPLKALEQLAKIKGEVNVTTSDGENLQAWALAQAENTVKQAGDTADEIIRQAQQDSEQIKKQAHRDGFQQGSREGYDKGRRDGYDKGYREGIAKAEKETAALISQARDALDQARDALVRTEKHRRSTIESLEQEIIDLALEIAGKLLSAQLTLDKEIILGVAAESIRLVADRLNVVLYVNPEELALVESKIDELKSLLPALGLLHIFPDSAIGPGGCKVETEQGRVDATMETRREALLKALYGKEQ